MIAKYFDFCVNHQNKIVINVTWIQRPAVFKSKCHGIKLMIYRHVVNYSIYSGLHWDHARSIHISHLGWWILQAFFFSRDSEKKKFDLCFLYIDQFSAKKIEKFLEKMSKIVKNLDILGVKISCKSSLDLD